MSFFRRIGTVRHKFKVEFFIKRVTFNKVLGGTVYVSLHRGDHKAKTDQVSFKQKTCQFNNQMLTVPITLFYDESEHTYQEKPGEIRVILKTDSEDKKLLGVVPFDIALYANQTGTKTFKEKKQLQQTPTNLKAHITFQVYLEHIGEGSQNSKSLAKDEKASREESPLNKITNFFGNFIGNTEEHEDHSSTPKQSIVKSEQVIKKSASKKLSTKPQQQQQQIKSKSKIGQTPSRKSQQRERQQEELFNRRKPEQKSKKQKRKDMSSKPTQQGSQGQQDKEQALFRAKKSKQDKLFGQKLGTQLKQTSKQQVTEVNPFYFDDPSTFTKKNNTKERQEEEISKAPKANESLPSRKEKAEETPKRGKKIKQSTIPLLPKPGHEMSQKEYRNNLAMDNQLKRVIASEGKEIQENSQVFQQNRSEEVASWQQEKQKLQQKSIQLETQYHLLLNEFTALKQQLKSKDKIISELKTHTTNSKDISTQLAHTESKLKTNQQTINNLQSQNNNLQKQLSSLQDQLNSSNTHISKIKEEYEKIKAENEKLRYEAGKNQSFFRQTEEHYKQPNKASDLQEQVRRLQRQKNEYLLALQKQKEKSKKQAKKLSQEAEKEALNLKQYQEFSKAELKKLKDEALAKGTQIESWRQKAKEKARQLETLLRENKALNGSNIELKQKLASLKIKICEKLNDANEKGAFDIMQALTDLNEEF